MSTHKTAPELCDVFEGVNSVYLAILQGNRAIGPMRNATSHQFSRISSRRNRMTGTLCMRKTAIRDSLCAGSFEHKNRSG